MTWECPDCKNQNSDVNYLCAVTPGCMGTRPQESSGKTKKTDSRGFLLLLMGLIAAGITLYGIYWIISSRPTTTVVKPPTPILTPIPTPLQYYPTIASVPNVPQGQFFYGGSTSLAPLRNESIVSELRKGQPQFQVIYKQPAESPGSLEGIRRLTQKIISIAHSSRALKPEEVGAAKALGFELKEVPIAYDAIAIYVNINLSEQQLPGLTISQIRDIFTGKITNWKDVGGPDLSITPFTRSMGSGGTVDYFHDEILKKQGFAPNIERVEDPTSSIRRVRDTNGGIGYVTASEAINQPIRVIPIARDKNSPYVLPVKGQNQDEVNKTVISDGSYPIGRSLFVVYRLEGNSIHQQAGEAYIHMIMSDEGQKLVDKAGFVPIR